MAERSARTVRRAKSFCRVCMAGCATVMEIDENDKILSIHGDHDDPVSNGYACFKGLQAEESLHGPNRLLHPLKRMPDGSYVEIGLEQAFDEIAEKLAAIMAQDGPNAVAQFNGNGAVYSWTGNAMQKSFSQSIGSNQWFSTITIDQSAKFVSFGRLGGWAAGFTELEGSDVSLLISTNPLVAHGPPLSHDPVKRLKRERARGLKLIVIDPRRTETARHADLHLQPQPGQDVAIIGGIIRLILEEGWEDKEFCARYVGEGRMAALRTAVEPLTPDYVEARAGLQPGQIRQVAEMFARDSRKGAALAATGVNMTPFSNLAQHMADCLNVVCGRFRRAGDVVRDRSVLFPRRPMAAEVIPAMRMWEPTGPSRIRGSHSLMGERPSGTLADEILTPGEGRIRALMVNGADPASSLPDQRKAVEALRSLDLLVTIDPWPTPTARIAHYVLPCTMPYERADLLFDTPFAFEFVPGGWGRYTPPVVKPPAGSDIAYEWYMYWSIAKRLGVTITYDGKTELDMVTPPTCDDLISIRLTGCAVTLDELKRYPDGHDFGVGDDAVVLPPRPEATACFDVMPQDVADELRSFLARTDRPGHVVRDGKTFTHLLAVRRIRDCYNSVGTQVLSVRKRNPENPASLHPDDLAELGVSAGDRIEISSAHGAAIAIARADPDLRRGVITLAHGWGGLPDVEEPGRNDGVSVNLLIDTDRNFESINAMPHMSAVPVNIRPRPNIRQAADKA